MEKAPNPVKAMLYSPGVCPAVTYPGIYRCIFTGPADAEKQTVLEGVNAIDTAFLRADLAPEPVRLELKTLLLAVVMVLVTDFERPHAGFVRIDQQPLINAVNSMMKCCTGAHDHD